MRRDVRSTYRRPVIWAFATGFALQCSIGVFASILASFVLVAAEPKRCPLALPNVPFAAYLAGVGVGVAVCEACMDSELNDHSQESKLLWGFIVEVWPTRRTARP